MAKSKRSDQAARPSATASSELRVRLEKFGPDQRTLDAAAARVLRLATVQKRLKNARHRVLSTVAIEAEPTSKPSRPSPPSRRFRSTIYDYTNNRTLFVDGTLDDPRLVRVSESGSQPRPTRAEFEEAVAILIRDERVGAALREGRLRPYPSMPPVIPIELPDGRVERTLAVGLLPREGARGHEIVGVNMVRQAVVRFDTNAPPMVQARDTICGVPHASQATVSHVAGQAWVTVTQGGNTLWRFLLVRPAASSGTNGSGVELRYVDYRGKRVLYRAHVPILNVKYDGDACGPFRDWQNEEGMIHADGADILPGFRLCPTPAQTILDTGSDTGSFLGTAIYVQGQEVVIVSEMEADWYRYVSRWGLHADGTIRPRFGFSAVSGSCVCNRHHHHPYWRLDFDIQTPGNNRVREFNDPSLFGSSNWHDKTFEIRRPRDPARHRKWRIENTATGDAYEVIPGPDDGVATASPDWPYPKGDLWILRYRSTEIDDGSVAIGPPYEAQLDNWLTGEPILNQDVVIWYAAHFTHDTAHEPPGVHGHIVGPDLKPVKW
jgi:hypothetical protein